jgi:hypothetical protein
MQKKFANVVTEEVGKRTFVLKNPVRLWISTEMLAVTHQWISLKWLTVFQLFIWGHQV